MKWNNEQLKELKRNYAYYILNKKEAEIYFNRKWYSIQYKANKLDITKSVFSKKQIKKLKENYLYYLDHKEEAEKIFKKKWYLIGTRATQLGITSMKINKKCSMFLGCHVAERVLSHVFKDVERMSHGNKGFDFICNKGHKIDSKASCLNKNNVYTFVIKKNKIADYFLCIGFDNRVNLNPQHIWLFKSDDICVSDKSKRSFNEMSSIRIKNDIIHLRDFSKYELTDKLKETISCCDTLKSKGDLINAN